MSPSQAQRSLAAIVFTDVVGYSALSHTDDARALRMVEEHFQMAGELAPRFSGRVIKTIGDSVHMEFASAQSATGCAIALQQAQQQRNAKVPEGDQFLIRIGVHLGDIEHRGGDTYGDGVNIAARLQPLAPKGGIAISIDVRRQLREELRNRFISRGPQALKNIGTPIEMFVIEADALAGVEVAIPAAPAAVSAPPAAPVVQRAFPIRIALAALGAVVLAVALGVFWKQGNNGTVPADDKSIAVLPFADMSQAKDQEYFSDGIADDVLNLLAKVPQLKVIARTSSFSYKGKDTPIAEIARALQVASVLQGSVRKSGEQVRIAVQLIRAADSAQLWSETYDRKLDDVFKIQDEIAAAVVGQLRVKLLGEVPTAKLVDPKVYPLILQAQALSNQGSADGDEQAIAAFQQAIALAPNESRAWAGLSRVYFNQAITGRKVAERARLAKDAVRKALELDPGNVIALAISGRIAADLELDLPSAARSYQQALELEPGNLSAINSAAVMLTFIGRYDEALQLLEYRVAHDAANPTAYNNLGICLYGKREWDAAIDALRTTLRLSPQYGGARTIIGTAMLLGKRDATAALKEFEAESDELSRLASLPLALHALGRTKEADAALQAFIDKYGKEQPVMAASVHAYRGNPDAAFEWLDKAIAIKDPILSQVLLEPLFDSLHDDPRWLPFLRKVGSAPEQLAKIEFKVTLPQQGGP